MMIKFLLFSFFLAVVTAVFGGVPEDGLKQISLHDRICMKAFFDDAIKTEQIAHVLYFENKPVAIIGRILKPNHDRYNEILCLKGWYAFKKNEYLFPHPHFLFNERMVSFDENFKVLHIYLINKKALEICLDQHLHCFKEVLGKEFNPQQFIAQLQEGQSLNSLLHEDEMLLGILLGFGEESSKAFRDFNAKQIDYIAETETYCGIHLKKPKDCRINPVIFMGDPNSAQVKELTSAYEKELEEISNIYRQKKNSLIMVLEKLCEL
jgi:hypothetical protein